MKGHFLIIYWRCACFYALVNYFGIINDRYYIAILLTLIVIYIKSSLSILKKGSIMKTVTIKICIRLPVNDII
jgi:hypothetical protein